MHQKLQKLQNSIKAPGTVSGNGNENGETQPEMKKSLKGFFNKKSAALTQKIYWDIFPFDKESILFLFISPNLFTCRRIAVNVPSIPTSWGELIDKITILEIKKIRIKAPSAIKNISYELSLLQTFIPDEIASNPLIQELKSDLMRTNETLWEIEDLIREKELNKEFDEIFISLARSVYKTNDTRADIKRKINNNLMSSLTEEKSYSVY